MKPYNSNAVATVAAAFALILPTASDAEAAQRSARLDVSAIAEYVYPENGVKRPARMLFEATGATYLTLADGGKKIVRHDTATGKELETVFDASHTRESSISAVEDFTLSPDGTKLLIQTEGEAIYRRSFKAPYYVFEIKRNILRPLSKQFAMQRAPLFSPDGRMVAFVVDNNIYIKKIDYDSEVQVTTDGQINAVINGVPDWVYEEEFSTASSMTWAPDNSMLCFLRYDESAVPTYDMTLYKGWCHPNDAYALYPGTFSYKYPVAGEPNSKVTVHSYDVETRKTKEVKFSDPAIEYIPRIEYGATATQLMVVTLNRAQNRMELYRVNPKTTVVKSVLVEKAKAWLDPAAYENLSFTPDGFVLLSERSGWSHLYKYTYEGQMVRQVTTGNYDVTAYYGEDLRGNIYYQSEPAGDTSTNPAAALDRVVCSIDSQGKKIEALGASTGWNSAKFTPGMQYALLDHSDAQTPNVYTLVNAKGKTLRTLEDNAAYASRYAAAAKKEFITIPCGNTVLNAYIIRPANMSAMKQYPVIMWQYSGPGSQEVVNRWGMDWERYAADEGFVVVCVDPHGTAGRGAEFKNVVYKQLGRHETADQIAAARWIAQQPWADPARIGICGWSYGGYETLMAATAGDSPFAAAVAIAPVTSWRLYDTIYAERYMLTPGENEEGYNESAPLSRASSLECPLLIMAGTLDDNVHPANTIDFVGELQKHHRYADMMLFPAMNHSIRDCDARAVVYSRMMRFFADNL